MASASDSARVFWETKDQQVCNGDVGMSRSLPDTAVWNSIYCTIRDRRRSRSRTPSSSVPRSRTPSSVSSGRTTPTSGPQFRMTARTMSEEILSTSPEVSRSMCVPHSPHRYQTTCWLEPRPVPIHYSSTVYMRLGSTKKRYVEEVTFQTRLVPRRFSESIVTATAIPSRHYTAILEIQCLPPIIHVINLEELQGINGTEDEHDA